MQPTLSYTVTATLTLPLLYCLLLVNFDAGCKKKKDTFFFFDHLKVFICSELRIRFLSARAKERHFLRANASNALDRDFFGWRNFIFLEIFFTTPKKLFCPSRIFCRWYAAMDFLAADKEFFEFSDIIDFFFYTNIFSGFFLRYWLIFFDSNITIILNEW